MCETSSAEKYSRCIETIQKASQCAIQRVVINLYCPCNSKTLQLLFCSTAVNLLFPLFPSWGSLSSMVSCWNQIYSPVNNSAITEKVLVWAADACVFWQSATTEWVLAPAKQWLFGAILQFSVSWLHENCSGGRVLCSSVLRNWNSQWFFTVTAGILSIKTLVLVWESRWKLGQIVGMFTVCRKWRK